MKRMSAEHWWQAVGRLAVAILCSVLAVAAVVIVPTSVAQAATDVVTNCSGSSSVAGSLPYEVANAGSGDTVTFALSPPCATITPASTIGIAKDLTITGPGAAALAVSGGGTQEVFEVSGGTVSISGLTIENGNAGSNDGGGIENLATLTVSDSTLSNDSAADGGAIENGGTLTVTGSTLSHDTASSDGGAIESDTATMTVTNTTVAKDTATSDGGGIEMFDGSATITNSTISENSGGFGGGIEDDQGDLSMGATIVAGNPSGNDCILQLPIGTFTDLGNNLDDDGSCHLTAGSDLPSTAAGLDPSGLQDNGGPTQTVALAAGSAAINHVSNAPQCPAMDQRGAPRNVPCDIGAYDTTWGPAVSIAITGSQTSGEGSSLTYATDAPAGVISGTLSCTTVNGGTPISPSLPVGYYTIDGSSCSGLSSSNQATYAVFPSSYAGVLVVSPSPAWAVSPSPDPGATSNVLRGVSCASETFCVAVGYQTSPGSEQTLIETWNGSSWSVTTSPDGGGDNALGGVSCTSATFCVAVGQDQSAGTEQTLVEMWNGSAWSISSSPDQGGGNNFLNGVSCTSATACQAVGFDESTSTDTVIEMWNGASWSLATSVNPSGIYNELLAVSCTSATACVAVGYDTPGSTNQTLIETLSGGSWSATTSPDPGPGDNALDGVSCTSATACVAVGSQENASSVDLALIETLSGGTWSVTTSPNRGSSNNVLLAVTCAAVTSCQAAGEDIGSSAQQTLIESWNGSSWTLATSPSPGTDLNSLNDIACTTATACQAIGDTSDGSSNQTLIETPSLPVVSAVNPSAGEAGGGNTVTIIGSGFTGATAVDFGSTPATIESASGDTKLTVTVPAGTAGPPIDVTVTAPGGVSATSPADQYTYTVNQTTPQTEPCTPTCTTNTVSTPLNNTSVSVTGSSGTSNPDATTNLLINTATLNCGTAKTHNYDYLTAVSTLSTTDFASGQVLTVTEVLGTEPSITGVKVCYAASATATTGTFLKKCKPSGAAPCLKTLVEQSGNVVATLLVPATDPRFWAGDGALDVTSFSPAQGPPGTTVTIKGKNLSQIRSVVIGGAEAPLANQATSSKVVVKVPSTAAQKAGVITVTGASGEAVSTKLFTVN